MCWWLAFDASTLVGSRGFLERWRLGCASRAGSRYLGREGEHQREQGRLEVGRGEAEGRRENINGSLSVGFGAAKSFRQKRNVSAFVFRSNHSGWWMGGGQRAEDGRRWPLRTGASEIPGWWGRGARAGRA